MENMKRDKPKEFFNVRGIFVKEADIDYIYTQKRM